MKSIFYFLFSCFFLNTIHSQKSSHSTYELNSLVTEYEKVFLYTKSVIDTMLQEPSVSKGLWEDLLIDNEINKNRIDAKFSNEVASASFSDIGLKWVSDATYNFSPGIAENEDVFFRSRISTGLDWVILGGESMHRKKQEYNIFNKQMLKDSVQFQLQNSSILLQNRQAVIQYIFDLHRLNILKQYETVLSKQSEYHDQMHQKSLNSKAEKIQAQRQVDVINDMVNVLQKYISENEEIDFIQKYWNLPYDDADLTNLSNITVENLLKEEQVLVQIQKDILSSKQRTNNWPSLRAKLRYNYYDNDSQQGRSFASVGASLTVPIRFGKGNEFLNYELASYEDKLYYDKLKLKQELTSKHKAFYTLKNKLLQLEGELNYIKALINNELDVYYNENKSFSPTKYIEYAGKLVQNKLTLLDVKQQLCQEYVTFQTLSGMNLTSDGETVLSGHNTSDTTYMWKSFFEAHTNQDLLSLLLKYNIKILFLSPGENSLKIKEFIQEAKKQDIKVYRLIGENSFAQYSDGVERLNRKLNEVEKFDYAGVNLDIEPHTFEDYKQNKELYVKRMNALYIAANKWSISNNIKLSVSIPMHLPVENAIVLEKNKIKAYVMAYEEVDQTKLINRTKILRETLGENFVWVLRLSDFENDEILKSAEKQLKIYGINKIAYYDFSTLTNSQ